MKRMKKHESGRSMIEMIGVLAVASLLMAGAFVLITSVTKSQKISRAKDDVANIVVELRQLDWTTTELSELSHDDLSKGTAILEKLHLPTSSPFGADSKYSVAAKGTEQRAFIVYITGLSYDFCIGLKNIVWPHEGQQPQKICRQHDGQTDYGIAYLVKQ